MPLTFSTVTVAGPLVSLDEMKQHLRITDTASDADVTAIRDAAQEAILAYLTTAGDATWTELTAPKRVVHAIKLLATNYYEHRGDDMSPSMSGAQPDTEVWAAITRLLAICRDPTLV
jgi:Phage gp6-like head-tail connector protein